VQKGVATQEVALKVNALCLSIAKIVFFFYFKGVQFMVAAVFREVAKIGAQSNNRCHCSTSEPTSLPNPFFETAEEYKSKAVPEELVRTFV